MHRYHYSCSSGGSSRKTPKYCWVPHQRSSSSIAYIKREIIWSRGEDQEPLDCHSSISGQIGWCISFDENINHFSRLRFMRTMKSSNSSVASSSNIVGDVPDPNGRGMIIIVWSALPAVLLNKWTSINPGRELVRVSNTLLSGLCSLVIRNNSVSGLEHQYISVVYRSRVSKLRETNPGKWDEYSIEIRYEEQWRLE